MKVFRLCSGVCAALAACLVTVAFAQAPAASTVAPEAKPAEVAPAGAKAVPALPAKSTAAPGWNVPPKWDDVQLKPQYASVPGRETNVLEQDSGQWWRTVRNGPVTFYGGVLLLVAPAFLLLFYFVKGPFKLHSPLTGKMMERFNSLERTAHWTMALSFVVLAVSGIMMLFGKYFLMPVLGASLFAALTTIGKNLHNFVGPLFMFSLVVSFVVFVKDNFMSGNDFAWLAKFGGLLSGNHMPAGRFNGGEKIWFWLAIVIFGIVISASGLIMLFPNWNQTRELMAEANLFHAVAGVCFMAATLAHIYIGTIGTEGAYQGMREGFVDEAWAKEHHSLWYDEVKSGKRAAPSGAQPATGDD